jgi:osmotically-inducible protein OsmY
VLRGVFAQTHKAPPTDWDIEAEVQKDLANDHIFVGSSILSSVNKGVVKLICYVRSETEKEYASSDLANLPGVKTVLNNLEVHDNSFHPAPTPAKVAGPTGPKTITLP